MEEGQSLSSVFNECLNKYKMLERTCPSSTDRELCNQAIQEVLDGFLLVSSMMQREGIFSPNEDLDDISSSKLKYILTDYYIGELRGRLIDSDRIKALKQSNIYLQAFLHFCEKLKLIDKADLEALHREGISPPPAVRRAEKIERAKREKQIMKRLSELLNTENGQKPLNVTDVLFLKDDFSNEDENLREFSLLRIALAIRSAIDTLESNLQEIQLLDEMERAKSKNGGQLPSSRSPEVNIAFQKPLLITRDSIQREVFAWKNLPSMMPEEWAELQIKQGLLPTNSSNPYITANKQSETETSPDSKVVDEDEESKRLESISWDDWKDDNPRGQGNMNDHYFHRG